MQNVAAITSVLMLSLALVPALDLIMDEFISNCVTKMLEHPFSETFQILVWTELGLQHSF